MQARTHSICIIIVGIYIVNYMCFFLLQILVVNRGHTKVSGIKGLPDRLVMVNQHAFEQYWMKNNCTHLGKSSHFFLHQKGHWFNNYYQPRVYLSIFNAQKIRGQKKRLSNKSECGFAIAIVQSLKMICVLPQMRIYVRASKNNCHVEYMDRDKSFNDF